MIQRNFRDLQVRRDKAARRIQNWYIERTRKRFLQNNKYKPNFDMKSSITNSDQRSPPSTDFLMFHTARRKLLRSHTSSTGSQDELLFVPSILSNSREMAHNRHIRQGSQNLPVEERLKIQEKIRKSKIDEHRKRREEEEYKDITHSPVINTSRYYDKDFYERQAIKTQEIKMKREMLTLQHQAKINEGLTFKPTINSSKEKSTYKTVDKLLNWAAIKQKEKEIAIKAKNDEESKITEKFKLSKTSERLAKNRNLKRQNSISVNQQIQETLQAYWPNKK